MAVFKFFHEWDWEGAEEELDRALDLNPDYSPAYQWKADIFLAVGRFKEAEAAIRRGLVLDPLSPVLNLVLGEILATAGRPLEAIELLKSSVKRWPRNPLLHLWIGISHLYAGDPEAGLQPAEVGLGLSGAIPFFESMRGVLLATVGRVAEAREVLEDLKVRSSREYVDPCNLFYLTRALDGFDAAAPYLKEALEVRSFFLQHFCGDPFWQPFHGDPRFRAVLEKVCPEVSFEA